MSLKELLEDYDKSEVEVFSNYVIKLKLEKDKHGAPKNPWAVNRKDELFAPLFKKNKLTGLKFDGVHVTINQHGLSYDYIAYKNRLLIAYPETELRFSEVYEGDEFSFSQNEKEVKYNHVLKNPFNRDTKNIIGVYCVIKNKRGHFLTLLDKNEIAKHRKVAKTQYIWNAWELEMIYKTVIKKATRIHYEDVYKEMNEEDNKGINLNHARQYKMLKDMDFGEKQELQDDFKESLEELGVTDENMYDVRCELGVIKADGKPDLTNIRKWLNSEREVFEEQVLAIIENLKSE